MLQCYAVGYNGVLVHNINGEELGAPKESGGEAADQAAREEWQRQHDELQDKIDSLQQEIDDKLEPTWGYGKNRVDGSEQHLQELLQQMARLMKNKP
jgi:hypothetical protein